MKKIVNTPCDDHIIKSPTVYQTNLLSDHWLLNDMKM